MKFLKRFGYQDGHIVIDVKPEEKKIVEVKEPQQEEEENMNDEKNKRYLISGSLLLIAFSLGYLRGVKDMVKRLHVVR